MIDDGRNTGGLGGKVRMAFRLHSEGKGYCMGWPGALAFSYKALISRHDYIILKGLMLSRSAPPTFSTKRANQNLIPPITSKIYESPKCYKQPIFQRGEHSPHSTLTGLG